MKFFDEKKLFHMDTATQDSAIAKADEGCRKAEASVTDALLALGRAYFEANRENPESEHHEEIVQIAAYMDREKLWRQYRLSLEGEILCENCGTVVTSDSAFCKKCGSPMKTLDFSALGIEAAPGASVCKSCGAPLAPDSAFCEACGAKV